ncbi:MAG: hypothetical protein IIB63_04680 [Proteobacteria bacterium]|nr:hypothetical protein [Pseudomonadota bacterium]
MSITDRLKRPFDPRLIKWRVGATNAKSLNCKPWQATSGIALAYVDARDVMKRFDDVCGDLWQVEYPFVGCCRIGVKIQDEWLWRSNGAGTTDVEGEKGLQHACLAGPNPVRPCGRTVAGRTRSPWSS